jgi:hypothetical protein
MQLFRLARNSNDHLMIEKQSMQNYYHLLFGNLV